MNSIGVNCGACRKGGLAMKKIWLIALLASGLVGCSWLDLVEPTLKVVDGIEELSEPVKKTDAKGETHSE